MGLQDGYALTGNWELFLGRLGLTAGSGVLRRATAFHLPVYILPQFNVFKATLLLHGNPKCFRLP